MAKIKQIGIGRNSSGTIDGITYVTRKGVTYARSTPNMPAYVYNTPGARKRQAIFKLIQMHIKYHLRTIRQTITPKENGTPANRYMSLNYKALSLALDDLADLYVAGQDVTLTHVEQAICAYAAEHPASIRIASLDGYQEIFLTGAWPETITLNAKIGDNTVIIIVSEKGVQTTINADGTITTSQYQGGSNGSDNGSGPENGSQNNGSSSSGSDNGGSEAGGSDNGGGDDQGNGDI